VRTRPKLFEDPYLRIPNLSLITCYPSPPEKHAINITSEVIYNYEFGDDEGVDGHAGTRFFVSTRRLLTTAPTSVNIHADATYKLFWQGFPILIDGTTDLDHHFHPFEMAVCTNEK
jgi:hypothetical protein